MVNKEIVVKNTNIKQIFETMEYGNVIENVDLAKEWFKKQNNASYAWIETKDELPNGTPTELKHENGETIAFVYQPDALTIDKILTSAANSKNKWCDVPAMKRKDLLTKLANEIKNKTKLFCQIEMCTRGILSKDTSKNLMQLCEYFVYYSSYAVRHEKEDPSWKPNGLVACVITDENPLSTMSLVLGPALAAGYNVILQTGLKFTLGACLLVELATKIGIPEGVLRIIPGNNVELQNIFAHDGVSVVSVFGKLYEEMFNVCNPHLLKLMTFAVGKVPMIVFNNADLDSACDSLTSSAWSCKSLNYWSVNMVLVQEDILKEFISKLKVKIDKLNIGLSTCKTTDVSYSQIDPSVLEIYDKLLKDASQKGIDVYFDKSTASHFKPTLLIGGHVYSNNVIKENIDIPVVTVLGFRTVNEAVLLANNSRLGYGASVWTQNISLANEISRKLKAGNVWINSSGLQMPSVAVSPFKDSGNFYFGGEEGFYEYVNVKKFNKKVSSINSVVSDKEKLINAISIANKTQVIWHKKSIMDRADCLKKFADNIVSLKSSIAESSVQTWIDDWITTSYLASTKLNYGSSNEQGQYNIITYREPRGVIAIECGDDINKHNIKLILASLLLGNSVIILNCSKMAECVYNDFVKFMIISGIPSGVFNILSNYNTKLAETAALNKQLDVYVGDNFNYGFSSTPLKDAKKFKYVVTNKWNEVINIVTKCKNVWFDVQQSFL